MTTEVQTETSLQQHIDAALDAARETLKQRELAAAQRALEAQETKRREIDEAWQPLLAAIRRRLPEWAHPYLSSSEHAPSRYDSSGGTLYTYATIMLPGCTPIAAWELGNGVSFEAMAPELIIDDDADIRYVGVFAANQWRSWWDSTRTDSNFDVAVLAARQNYEDQQRMQAEAYAVNQVSVADTLYIPDPEPQPTPAQKLTAMLAGTSELIQRFAEGDWLIKAEDDDVEDFADNRTVLLATVGLTVAAQLGRIADVLEASRE